MDYKYDVVNYDKNIPATIMHLNLSSNTRITELQWHREPELVYVIEGTSECSRNGEFKIVEEGEMEQVFNHPRHPYTTQLISAFPRSFKR